MLALSTALVPRRESQDVDSGVFSVSSSFRHQSEQCDNTMNHTETVHSGSSCKFMDSVNSDATSRADSEKEYFCRSLHHCGSKSNVSPLNPTNGRSCEEAHALYELLIGPFEEHLSNASEYKVCLQCHL